MNSGEMVRGNVPRGLLQRRAFWELILPPHPGFAHEDACRVVFARERIQLRLYRSDQAVVGSQRRHHYYKTEKAATLKADYKSQKHEARRFMDSSFVKNSTTIVLRALVQTIGLHG
jgi:hypothetical protein